MTSENGWATPLTRFTTTSSPRWQRADVEPLLRSKVWPAVGCGPVVTLSMRGWWMSSEACGAQSRSLARIPGCPRTHRSFIPSTSLLWPGYDEQNVNEITTALRATEDDDVLEKVRVYEQAHKNRASVLKATERKLAAVS